MFKIDSLKARGVEWARFLHHVQAAGGPVAYELELDRLAARDRETLIVQTTEAVEYEWRDALRALVRDVPEAAELAAALKTGVRPLQVFGFVGAALRAAARALAERDAALVAMTEGRRAAAQRATASASILSAEQRATIDAAAQEDHRLRAHAARVVRETKRRAAAYAQPCPTCRARPGAMCVAAEGHTRRGPHPARFEGLPPSRGTPVADQSGADAPKHTEK